MGEGEALGRRVNCSALPKFPTSVMLAAMGVSQRPAEQKAFIADMAAREADRKEALAIIEAWNARLAARQPELASPTLRAALTSGCHWLHVICPACETVAEIDLRVVRRDLR